MPVKTLKHTLVQAFQCERGGVGHCDPNLTTPHFSTAFNLALGVVVFRSVAHQVGQELEEQVRIGFQAQAGRNFKIKADVGAEQLQVLDHLFHQI